MGLIKTITTYPGTKSSNTTTVKVYVDVVTNNNTTYAIDVYCTAVMKSGWWVQSSGLMFYSSATGHTMQGGSSICGNTFANNGDGHKEWGGTTYTSAKHRYSWSKNENIQSINVYVDVYRSTDLSSNGLADSASTSLSIGKKIFSWDINAYHPNSQNQHAASFDEYIGDVKVNGNNPVTNEVAGYNEQPYGTYCYVANVTPIYDYYEIEKMTDSGGDPLVSASNGRQGVYINGVDDDILIYTRFKHTTIDFYLEEELSTLWHSRELVWGDTTELIPIPEKIGYEFLGWFIANNDKPIFNANGEPNLELTNYWNSNGTYRGVENLNAFALWKTQNVAYVKDNNGNYQLSIIYIKDTDNKYQPAIMYVRTEDGWKQSITK